jgi:hypothetical protein
MIRRLALPFAVVGVAVAFAGASGAIALRLVDPVPVVATVFGFSVAAVTSDLSTTTRAALSPSSLAIWLRRGAG